MMARPPLPPAPETRSPRPGLDPRLPARPKADRAAEAVRLQKDGHTLTQIASALGVSRGTAASALRAMRNGRYCSCGELVTKVGAEDCNRCSPKLHPRGPEQLWTSDRITAAINAFFVEHGRPPSVRDWLVATSTTPCYSHVTKRFGSFNNGIRQAGYTPRRSSQHFGSSRAPGPAPTVANGFSPEEELAWLIAEQERDDRKDKFWTTPIDGNEWRFHGSRAFSDAWTHAVHSLVDWRREIDSWAEEAA